MAVGNGAIAWLDNNPGTTTIRLARADRNGRWLPATTVGRIRGHHVGPAFAVSAAGLIVVPRQPLMPSDQIS